MKTVLVVEDNVDNLELITVILRQNCFKVLTAENGENGVKIATEEQLDFIILDIQLPDMDGFDVLKAIRTLKINGDRPIIAMTSYAMSGDRQKVMKAGFNGYIEKPIEPERIIRQIKEVIGDL
ncbi:MAG: response regulator [Gammaproteobacteria bacterium]|nr:response regulator [Gammaproteobacteria bacterium]